MALILADARLSEILTSCLPSTGRLRFRHRTTDRLGQAVDLLRDNPPDLVLLATDLPRCPAHAAFAALHAVRPSVPVVLVGSGSERHRYEPLLRSGAQDFVSREGLVSETLHRVVVGALNRADYLRSVRVRTLGLQRELVHQEAGHRRFKRATQIAIGRLKGRALAAQSAMSAMTDAVIVTDAEGRVVFSNAVADRLFVRPLERPGKRTWARAQGLYRADRKTRFLQGDTPMAKMLSTGSKSDPIEMFIRNRSVPKGRWIIASARPLRIGGGEVHGGVTVFRDDTARRSEEARLIAAVNHEKRRIGRDLHDGLGQQLTGIAYRLEALSERTRSLAARKLTDELITLVDDAIRDTRGVARGLHPVDPSPRGLVVALLALSQRIAATGVNCTLACDEALEVKDVDVADGLYRIAAEAVSNALRHARPATIAISPVQATAATVLEVLNSKPRGARRPIRGGLGEGIMRYRANAMGGRLVIADLPGGGRVVRCAVPTAKGRLQARNR